MMHYPEDMEERSRSLGIDPGRMRELLKAGYCDPSYDLIPKGIMGRDNPNRNITLDRCNRWVLKWTQDGKRQYKVLCTDLEQARAMRDEFFDSINYYKD
jgi:hypothetical protein